MAYVIRYSLHSKPPVLGVYCSKCNVHCSFEFKNDSKPVAYWTKEKREIRCLDCMYQPSIYREVRPYGDIPLKRSDILIDWRKRLDYYLYGSDETNKTEHREFFCSEEDEKREFEREGVTLEKHGN